MPQIIPGEPPDHVDVVLLIVLKVEWHIWLTLNTKQTETREDQTSLGLHLKFESLCMSGLSDLNSYPSPQFNTNLPHRTASCPGLILKVQPLYLPFPLPEMCFPDWNMISAPVFTLSSNVTSSWEPSVTTPSLRAHSKFTLDHTAVCDRLFTALLTI